MEDEVRSLGGVFWKSFVIVSWKYLLEDNDDRSFGGEFWKYCEDIDDSIVGNDVERSFGGVFWKYFEDIDDSIGGNDERSLFSFGRAMKSSSPS